MHQERGTTDTALSVSSASFFRFAFLVLSVNLVLLRRLPFLASLSLVSWMADVSGQPTDKVGQMEVQNGEFLE